MTPLTLKLESPSRREMTRTGATIREALAILWGRGALDCIREPAGLEYPVSPRARRLMRSARVAGC